MFLDEVLELLFFCLKSILVLFLGFLFECSLFLLALIVYLCLKILIAVVIITPFEFSNFN